jgi:hypothetical protein
LALATLVDEVQQASPQQSQPLPLFDVPALAVASQEQAGQVQPSPQQEHDTLAAFVSFAALASFSQHALALALESATLADLASVAGQQAAPPQQSQPSASAFVASHVQAGHAQASPQQAHAASVALVFSAALVPTLIRPARAKAPTMLSNPRRSMIRLPTR